MKNWFDKKDPVMADLDLNVAVLAAFLHDIGKAGDCIFDMYEAGKYGQGKTEEEHP